MTEMKPAKKAENPKEIKVEEESGATPTKPPENRKGCLQIDGFGLPVNGVARAEVLKRLKVDDPALSTKEWRMTHEAYQMTEKMYG